MTTITKPTVAELPADDLGGIRGTIITPDDPPAWRASDSWTERMTLLMCTERCASVGPSCSSRRHWSQKSWRLAEQSALAGSFTTMVYQPRDYALKGR
jgi:hypothetical protein